jgi:hypothetical protein
MFLFFKIPSAFFSGVRIVDIDEESCVVQVPYSWFSKNPFGSTYFACLSMAAEMSTGALAMVQVYKRQPPVSMLVIKTEASYFKKARGITRFTCNSGAAIRDAVLQSIQTGEGQEITVISTGRDQANEKVAEFRISWSFKPKK